MLKRLMFLCLFFFFISCKKEPVLYFYPSKFLVKIEADLIIERVEISYRNGIPGIDDIATIERNKLCKGRNILIINTLADNYMYSGRKIDSMIKINKLYFKVFVKNNKNTYNYYFETTPNNLDNVYTIRPFRLFP